MVVNLPANDPAELYPLTGAGTILVVTGKRGVGKTTYCQKLVEGYRKAGLNVGGISSPGRFENQLKNGIFAVDLVGNQSQLLASQVTGETDGLKFGPWTFDVNVFEWGNQRLLQSAGSDVLVIDELGFLEFDLQKGWMVSFEVLQQKKFRLAIVVIRPECIAAFSKMGFSFQTREILSPQPPCHPI